MRSAAICAAARESKRHERPVLGDESVDNRTLTELLKRLAEWPLLEREEETRYAVDIAESREAFATLVLGLRSET